METTKKMISTSSSSVSSTSPLSSVGGGGASSGGGNGEKKTMGNHSLISNLKHFVSDTGSNNGNGNPSVALGEELDGVERGEGAPLSHLTASRAKAPRRRLPSSQHLRHHATGTTTTAGLLNTTINAITVFNTYLYSIFTLPVSFLSLNIIYFICILGR